MSTKKAFNELLFRFFLITRDQPSRQHCSSLVCSPHCIQQLDCRCYPDQCDTTATTYLWILKSLQAALSKKSVAVACRYTAKLMHHHMTTMLTLVLPHRLTHAPNNNDDDDIPQTRRSNHVTNTRRGTISQ